MILVKSLLITKRLSLIPRLTYFTKDSDSIVVKILLAFIPLQATKSLLSQTVQNVISGVFNPSKSSACLLSGGETDFISAICSSRKDPTSILRRSSTFISIFAWIIGQVYFRYNSTIILVRDKLLMVMKLDKVVPFGRSLDEYIKMFDLTSKDLSKSILGVGDGPASFNAEGTSNGYKITSIDPIYQFDGIGIQQRFDAVVDNIINQVIATPNNWVWSYHKNPQDLKANRIKALELFLQDYEQGKQAGRYLAQELPCLDLGDRAYDLAICSHFLFLYSEQCDRDFHVAAIQEMLRVSKEVRIFPLLTLMQKTSPHLDFVLNKFNNLEYSTSIVEVPYELQPGANKMLVINHS